MNPKSHIRGFVLLNICQFGTAGNDNILKQVLIFGIAAGGIWADQFGDGAQAYASLALAIPFVLFSGFAGQFSDRFDKRSVCIVVKLVEVAIALMAMWGFWIANVWIVLAAMILISVQSTFFTPAKFGILPEIIDEPDLSRANGTISMFTYIAIILGTAIGGLVYGLYAPDLKKNPDAVPIRWLPGVIIVAVAIIGAASTFGIPRLKVQNPTLKIRPMLFQTYIQTWRDISGTTVASVIIAYSYFYLIVGGIALLILPDYRVLLNVSELQISILMVILGIATGVGDFAAGRASGHRIRPELIPFGGVGTTVMFFVLAFIPLNYYLVAICLGITGFLAGFVMVPLQTMTQQFSTDDERGQVLGLWNCLSFVGIIIGSLLFLLVRWMGLAPNLVFALCGVLGVILLVAYYLRWKAIFYNAVAESERELNSNT